MTLRSTVMVGLNASRQRQDNTAPRRHHDGVAMGSRQAQDTVRKERVGGGMNRQLDDVLPTDFSPKKHFPRDQGTISD